MHAWLYRELWFVSKSLFLLQQGGSWFPPQLSQSPWARKLPSQEVRDLFLVSILPGYCIWWLCGVLKRLHMQTTNTLDVICEPFAFLVPEARCVCSGHYTNLWPPSSRWGHLDSQCLFAADFCVFGVVIMLKLWRMNLTYKQAYLHYPNLSKAALRCENHVIFGNEKQGGVR